MLWTWIILKVVSYSWKNGFNNNESFAIRSWMPSYGGVQQWIKKLPIAFLDRKVWVQASLFQRPISTAYALSVITDCAAILPMTNLNDIFAIQKFGLHILLHFGFILAQLIGWINAAFKTEVISDVNNFEYFIIKMMLIHKYGSSFAFVSFLLFASQNL